MKKKFIEYIKWCLICVIVSLIVTYGWQGLELLIYGEIHHRIVDDIVGTVLVCSIVLNIMFIKIINKWWYSN